MTTDDAVSLLELLSAAYPSATLSEATIAVYVRLMLDLPYLPAQAAVLALIASERYLPSIAQIREATMDRAESLPDLESAWHEVATQVRTCGTWSAPTFSHPLIARVVNDLGWYDLCLSTHPETDRAHFLRLFAEAKTRLRKEWNASIADASPKGWLPK